MIPLTLAQVAALCGGRLEGGKPDTVVRRVSTDSREVREGDLFIGLRGETYDGDAYAPDALGAGAAAVVVREATATALSPRAPRVVVDDGLGALTSLAASVRRLAHVRVVAITGSAGKTSTKDILAVLLRPFANVVATTANYNNEVGVPLTILELDAESQVLVCELAMRGRGQIAHLARIAAPDVAVIINVAPAHLELVGAIEDVAAAKAEIFTEAPPAALVVPAGEKLLEPYLRGYAGRVITFGDDGDVYATDPRRDGFATHTLVDAFGRRVAVEFSFTGAHYLQDALAAIGAMLALGFGLEDAKTGAGDIVFSGARGRLSELADGGLLLDDTYNANPVATKAALDHLVAVADGRPVVAVLGDMYELGPRSPELHREVGERAATLGVPVVAVGELAKGYLTGAEGERWYATVEECLEALPAAVPPGGAVLVKASRALRLERVAEALAAARGAAGEPPAAPASGDPAVDPEDETAGSPDGAEA